jgi:hypothetical protein
MGFEPMTSSLPRKCSTPELRRLILLSLQLSVASLQSLPTAYRPLPTPQQSGRRGSNSRPIAWKAIALPTELLPLIQFAVFSVQFAVKTAYCLLKTANCPCGGRRIRTFVAEAADLQSAPFDRSGIPPLLISDFEISISDFYFTAQVNPKLNIRHPTFNRASYRDRTNDLLITSQSLYQLS